MHIRGLCITDLFSLAQVEKGAERLPKERVMEKNRRRSGMTKKKIQNIESSFVVEWINVPSMLHQSLSAQFRVQKRKQDRMKRHLSAQRGRQFCVTETHVPVAGNKLHHKAALEDCGACVCPRSPLVTVCQELLGEQGRLQWVWGISAHGPGHGCTPPLHRSHVFLAKRRTVTDSKIPLIYP